MLSPVDGDNMDAIIHFWDMDHTVVGNDCDVSWKLFLIEKGLAPETDGQLIHEFYAQYRGDALDIIAFNEFQLRELIGKTHEELEPLSREHFERVVRPRVYPRAHAMVKEQKGRGDIACMVTATNPVVARPVAEFFGFDELLCTELEIREGRFTGKIVGDYRVGAAKIPLMTDACRRHGVSMRDASYYGDSSADIPVLEAVGRPFAVNPPLSLREHAARRGWSVLEFSMKDTRF